MSTALAVHGARAGTPSPSVYAKAIEYLTTGRVRIDYADARCVLALVHGSRPTDYTITYLGNGKGWHCDCPAHVTCSHILAVQAVWSPR